MTTLLRRAPDGTRPSLVKVLTPVRKINSSWACRTALLKLVVSLLGILLLIITMQLDSFKTVVEVDDSPFYLFSGLEV